MRAIIRSCSGFGLDIEKIAQHLVRNGASMEAAQQFEDEILDDLYRWNKKIVEPKIAEATAPWKNVLAVFIAGAASYNIKEMVKFHQQIVAKHRSLKENTP